MLIYQSSFSLPLKYPDLIELLGTRRFKTLYSYYEETKGKSNRRRIREDFSDGVFLDSGAFSAFRQGGSIDLGRYADYLEIHGDEYDCYSGLDVIGDAVATYRNQKYLDERGLKAIPCFHVGEPYKYLRRYLERYPYIALGGMVPVAGTDLLRDWLHQCWKVIEKTDVKVHGFGMTDMTLIRCYPWYSIDSATANIAARYGFILSPWGSLAVCSKIKKFSDNSVRPGGLMQKRVMGWIQEVAPGIITSWEEIGVATAHAKLLRMILNAIFLERLVLERLDRPTREAFFTLV